MIILVIDVCGVAFIESESHAPIAANPHCPSTFPVAGERVQHEAWKVHVLGANRHIQTAENKPKPLAMLSVNARFGTWIMPAYISSLNLGALR